MSILYFDRKGNPIVDITQWGKMFEDRNYQIVKQDKLPNGCFVSTVWLGLDHSHGGTEPLIFETMVFLKDEELAQERYSTEKEALDGHRILLAKYSIERSLNHD